MAVPVVEKGYQIPKSSGLANWWAPPTDDEETPELVWPQSVMVYDRMRRQDAQVKSVLGAVTLPIRRTAWRVDGSGCKVGVTKLIAEDLGLPIVGQDPKPMPRSRDRFSWADHLRLALTMLAFGHSYFEQVYRIDEQDRARLRKLAWRPPRTISAIDVAADGGLEKIHQYGSPRGGVGDVEIPVNDLVAYVNEREGGNWLGMSLLRPAYKFWLLKDRALRTQSISLERNGVGVPVYKGAEIPDTIRGDERRKLQEQDLAAGMALASAYRGGENAGASVPHGADLTLKGVDGDLPDADKVIRYYDEQIARAVLAHFLNLGTETGSWALGSTFADFFTLSLQTVAMDIADVATQHVVEDLVDLNFGPDEPAPRIVFDEIGSQQQLTDQGLKMLVDAGIITPDEQLERYIRMRRGLPEPDPETAREKPAPATSSTDPGQPAEEAA